MHFQVKVGMKEVRLFSLAEKADGVPHLPMSDGFSGASAMSINPFWALCSVTSTSANKLSVSAKKSTTEGTQLLHGSGAK